MSSKAILIAASLIAADPAFAHGPTTGPNGGVMTDAGSYHLEAVAQGTDVSVYLLDADNQPLPADGFKGTAIFIVDGKPQRIVLTPAGANRLSGAAAMPVPAPRGAIQLTAPDGASAQGKFE